MKNTRANSFLLLAIFLTSYVLAVFLIVVQRGSVPVQKEFVVDEPAPRTVYSPIHFTFVEEEETARLRKEKEREALAVYTLDSKVRSLIGSQGNETFKKLTLAQGKEEAAANLEAVPKTLTFLFEHFLKDGVLEDREKKRLEESGRSKILKYDPDKKAQVQTETKDLISLSEARERAESFLEKEGFREKEVRQRALDIFKEVIRPNLFFDEAATQEQLKQTAESVPAVREEVKRGEMVIQKGLLVMPKQQKQLVQIHRKMAAKQVQGRLLSVGILVFLAFSLIFLYLKQFEPKQMHSPRFFLMVLSTFIITLGIERVILLIPGSSFYLLPGALAAVSLTILWSPAAGVLGALSMAILSVPVAEFRLEIVLMILLGSLAGAFSARRIRKRIHFLRVIFSVGAVNAIVLVASFSSQEWRFTEALNLVPFGFANGFIVSALSFFLVAYLFEPLFNLATDITLLELSDLNHPLLKRMVVEAPGTYHHSLVVSTLAEAACEAIGARALLARVGCYFHDIGKIARCEYFTENQNLQSAGDSHSKLTPTMSCLIIMSHVKDGMELAKKYKLKDVIVQFIPEHQGKGIIYYFYRKALDQAVPGEKVNPDDFRYPGPKPQSRETAVALLADSVEATSRSLKEVTPLTIRTLVRKIINEKFIDGQLDECDLTLRDLHKIQESFVHNLMAIFHTRVTYPTSQQDPRSPDLFETDQFTKFHED